MTFFWSTQWKQIQFTFTEANLLPDNHPENVLYKKFLNTFGEDGNLIAIALKDDAFFTAENLKLWKELNTEINNASEIDFIVSIDNLQELKKDNKRKELTLSTIEYDPSEDKAINRFKQKLFLELPFYENLIYDKKTETIRTIIYMDSEVVNTAARKSFIYNTFIPLVEAFEKKTKIDVKISGMPYVRTLNAQNIVDEIGLFVLGATLVTSLIFFLFFRSFRAKM